MHILAANFRAHAFRAFRIEMNATVFRYQCPYVRYKKFLGGILFHVFEF